MVAITPFTKSTSRRIAVVDNLRRSLRPGRLLDRDLIGRVRRLPLSLPAMGLSLSRNPDGHRAVPLERRCARRTGFTRRIQRQLPPTSFQSGTELSRSDPSRLSGKARTPDGLAPTSCRSRSDHPPRVGAQPERQGTRCYRQPVAEAHVREANGGTAGWKVCPLIDGILPPSPATSCR